MLKNQFMNSSLLYTHYIRHDPKYYACRSIICLPNIILALIIAFVLNYIDFQVFFRTIRFAKCHSKCISSNDIYLPYHNIWVCANYFSSSGPFHYYKNPDLHNNKFLSCVLHRDDGWKYLLCILPQVCTLALSFILHFPRILFSQQQQLQYQLISKIHTSQWSQAVYEIYGSKPNFDSEAASIKSLFPFYLK